jgi:hypothetical protein
LLIFDLSPEGNQGAVRPSGAGAEELKFYLCGRSVCSGCRFAGDQTPSTEAAPVPSKADLLSAAK